MHTRHRRTQAEPLCWYSLRETEAIGLMMSNRHIRLKNKMQMQNRMNNQWLGLCPSEAIKFSWWVKRSDKRRKWAACNGYTSIITRDEIVWLVWLGKIIINCENISHLVKENTDRAEWKGKHTTSQIWWAWNYSELSFLLPLPRLTSAFHVQHVCGLAVNKYLLSLYIRSRSC